MLALPKILPAHLHDVSPMVVVAARIRPSICFTLAVDNFSVNYTSMQGTCRTPHVGTQATLQYGGSGETQVT